MRSNLFQSLLATAVVLMLGVSGAAAQAPAQAPANPPSKFRVMSPAYAEGSMIPSQYTCADPNGASPALQWSNPPAAAMSFAVIFHDTRTRRLRKARWTSRTGFSGIFPQLRLSVPAGVKPDTSPDGIAQGKNVRMVNGFQPPCPGVGASPHHYVFELYALDTKLDLPAGSVRADLLKAMDGHVLGKATYFALFGR